MDIYHQVLAKLFEETGGSDSRAVDFADLVKKLGFHANYLSIYKELSGQGWIVETSKADWVKLTHWGIKEAKKSRSGADGGQTAVKESNRLLAQAREFAGLLEKLCEDNTKENFSPVEKKFSEISEALRELKAKF